MEIQNNNLTDTCTKCNKSGYLMDYKQGDLKLKSGDKITENGQEVIVTLIGEPQESYQIWEGVTDSGGPIWGYVWKENLKSVEKEKRTRV
jgi:hypothetical protein